MREEHFLRNARDIKQCLGLSTEEYLEIFQMSKKEAEETLLNPKNFPLSKAMAFCEYFELDIVSMFSNHFDTKSFIRNYSYNKIELPEIYQLDQNSRVITLINLLASLEHYNYGWLIDLIFRRLQIPKQIVHFPEMPISVKVITDFFEMAERFKVNRQAMESAGRAGISNLNDTFHFTNNFNTTNKEQSDINFFYEDFFECQIAKFDKSFIYQIDSFKKDSLVVKCTAMENIKEVHHKKTLSDNMFIHYKLGIASGLSKLLELPHSNVKILNTESESGYDLIGINITRPQSLVC